MNSWLSLEFFLGSTEKLLTFSPGEFDTNFYFFRELAFGSFYRIEKAGDYFLFTYFYPDYLFGVPV